MGELRRLEGHEQVLLTGPWALMTLREGHLALYGVQLSDGEPSGQRHYLLTLHAGALLSAGEEGENLAILAVPLGDHCLLEEVAPESLLRDDVPGAAGVAGPWRGLLETLETLARSLGRRGPAPGYLERATVGEDFSYHGNLAFQPQGPELSWLHLESGELLLLGQESLALSAGTFLPVSPGVWGEVRGAAAGCFRSSSEQLKDREGRAAAFSGAQALTTALLRQTWCQLQAEARDELERIERLHRRRVAEQRTAVANLSLEGGERAEFLSGEPPLLAALGVIGRRTGISFRPPEAALQAPNLHEEVAGIARASSTRLRRVQLRGRWWEQDVGALLAFREADGEPVALTCEASWLGIVRRYRATWGRSGETEEVDEALALCFSQDAYCFVEPLPLFEPGGLRSLELARFATRPFLGDARLVFLLTLVGSLLALIYPMANRLMIDQVIPDAHRGLIVDLAVGMAALSLGMFLFELSQGLVSLRIQTGLTGRLQASVMDRMLRLPSRFFREYSSGDLLNRVMMISEISAGISSTALRSLLSLLSLGFMLGLCFYYNRTLAWLALGTALITSCLSIAFSFAIRQIALRRELESGKLFGFVVQMVHGVTKLQTAGAEERAFGKWAERYGEILRADYRIHLLQQTSGVLNGFLRMISTALLFYFAGQMVEKSLLLRSLTPLAPSLLTIGTFFAFQAAFQRVVGGTVEFFGTFLDLHQLMAKRDLVTPLLEAPVESSVARTDPGQLEGKIELKGVSFRYQEGGASILDRVSLHAYPGEFVALVGPSGCGKSTLLKLLLGFEEAESGVVLFDGRDLGGLDLAAVRRQIGVVLQGGMLSAGSLFQIIAGARPLTMDQVWMACEEAAFAEDVRAMPMGLHTLMTEGATTLSGGQRQRLMIARALAQDPRLVLFDEATSALDNQTQRLVTESLARRKVTRLVVAHRLSTIRDADRIYVLDRGKIQEVGTYQELMDARGIFHRLASRQLIEEAQ